MSDTIKVKFSLAHARLANVKAETVVEFDREDWEAMTSEECERAVLDWAFNDGLEIDWQETED